MESCASTPAASRTRAWLKAHGVELLDSCDALLGQGERGSDVWLGRRKNEVVAVKVVEATRRVTSLSALPAPVAHRHLVRVIERLVDTDNARWVEVRVLCSGGELYDRIAEDGPLTKVESLALFQQMVRAVATCHDSGIANGQVRPEHVLLDGNNDVQLLGFVHRCGAVNSLTRSAGASADPTAEESVSLRVVRPLDAPEWHAHGGASASSGAALAPADVWSVALLYLVMVCGGPPFTSADAKSCPAYASFCRTGNLSELVGAGAAALIPPWLLPLLSRALLPNPAQRPTAAELRNALPPVATWATPPLPAGHLSLSTTSSVDVVPSGCTSVVDVPSPLFNAHAPQPPPASGASAATNAAGRGGDDEDGREDWWRAGWRAGWNAATALQTLPPPPPRAPPRPPVLAPELAVVGHPRLTPTANDALLPLPNPSPPTPPAPFMADSSRATAVGAGLGAANDGLPPLRPAAHQGFVRSLGWLALPHPWDALITSISASLGEQLRL